MEAIENGQVVASDVRHLADDEAIPEAGRVSVSLERFAANRDELVARGDVGLRLASHETAEQASPHLDDVAFVALEFPKFADGRPYSTARLLRDRYGYSGQLRATGDVLRDQLFYMQRCGFDVLEVRAGKDANAAVDALDEFSVTYQTAADGRPPVYVAD